METKLAGRYQIVRHLGGGGFGQTFLAKDLHLPGQPLCVIKQLKPRVNDPIHLQTAKRLFNQEAETLYRLGSHDQIPRLLAHFEQNNEFYLAQEYIQGHSLNLEVVPGKRLDETYTVELLHDILSVLAFVHQQHVIHRDIKPANLIRRSSDRRIVVIDFGAVKEVRNQTASLAGPTSVTVAIGSPGYMPSEQQAAKPHYSSDVYAVGMVGFEALTGLRPRDFPRDPETAEFSCGLVQDLVSVSPEFAAVLDRMVRYDYRQRYANAAEAFNALQQLFGNSESNLPLEQSKAAETQFLSSTRPVASFNPTVPYQGSPNPIAPNQKLPNQTVPYQSLKVSPEAMVGTAEPTSGSSGTTQLSKDLKKSLEQLLASMIGPIAPVILKRSLEQCLSGQELLGKLVVHLPEQERSRFRDKAHELLQKFGDPFITSTQNQTLDATIPPTLTPAVTSDLDPAFIKWCEQELAKTIGPIAALMVKRTLTQHPEFSRLQLVEALVTHLPNEALAETFRRTLLAS